MRSWKGNHWMIYFNAHPRICLLILEKEDEGRRETDRQTDTDIHVREKHWSVASRTRADRGWTCNLVTCPDWASNPEALGAWDDDPTNWTTGQAWVAFYWGSHSRNSLLVDITPINLLTSWQTVTLSSFEGIKLWRHIFLTITNPSGAL